MVVRVSLSFSTLVGSAGGLSFPGSLLLLVPEFRSLDTFLAACSLLVQFYFVFLRLNSVFRAARVFVGGLLLPVFLVL